MRIATTYFIVICFLNFCYIYNRYCLVCTNFCYFFSTKMHKLLHGPVSLCIPHVIRPCRLETSANISFALCFYFLTLCLINIQKDWFNYFKWSFIDMLIHKRIRHDAWLKCFKKCRILNISLSIMHSLEI